MSKKSNICKIEANLKESGLGEISLRGSLDHEGWKSESFINEFNWLESQAPNKILIKINCTGGSVINGLDIIDTIMSSNIPTVAHITGIAASMASVIALAADETIINDYALIMWHNPFDPTGELNSESGPAVAMKNTLIKLYSNRLGKSEDEVEAFMKGVEGEDGTYFTADKAEELGLVSKVIPTRSQSSKKESFAAMVAEFEGIEVPENIQKEMDSLCEDMAKENKEVDTKVNDTALVEANLTSVSEVKRKRMAEDLKKICAKMNLIEDSNVQAIEAKVDEIVASNTKLGADLEAKDLLLVTAKTNLENVSAQLEGEKANVVELEARLKVYKDAEIEAHKVKIEADLAKAKLEGKITDGTESVWRSMLEANYDDASVALQGVIAAGTPAKKLSDKVKPEIEASNKDKEPKIKGLKSFSAMAEELENKNK